MVALDIRFNLFTGWKPAILRAVGWLLRTVIVLFSSVTVFFCGRVITGGMVNTAGRADYAIVLGLALEKENPRLTCWQDSIWPGMMRLPAPSGFLAYGANMLS